MKTMSKVAVTAVSLTIIEQYVNQVLAGSPVIGWYQDKCNTFPCKTLILVQFPERVDQNIDALVTEFISSAVYNVQAVISKLIAQNSFSYTSQFTSGCQLFLAEFFRIRDK